MLAAAVASLVSAHASSSTTASRAVLFHSWNSPPTQAALTGWEGDEQTADVVGSIGRQMHLLPGLLTAEEMAALHAAAVRCQAYDADEPDSVDMAPTFQAHIFEAGEPRLAELAALLAPIIETRLLPYVRAKFGCPDACVADGLLRRYRAGERTSLALHYDVEALATAILPLSVQQGEEKEEGDGDGVEDSAAAAALSTTTTYSGGLFVQGGPSRRCRRYVRFPRQGDVLTRTSRGLRTVRTGCACQPPACCTYRRLRAAPIRWGYCAHLRSLLMWPSG